MRATAWRSGIWHALWAGDATVVLGYAGLTQTVVWAGASHEAGVATVIGARARAVRARWGWRRAGRWFGPTEARAALGRTWKERAVGWWKTVSARDMVRWAQEGSCSGAALAEVGERYVVSRVRAPRVGVRRRRQLAGEQRGCAPRNRGCGGRSEWWRRGSAAQAACRCWCGGRGRGRTRGSRWSAAPARCARRPGHCSLRQKGCVPNSAGLGQRRRWPLRGGTKRLPLAAGRNGRRSSGAGACHADRRARAKRRRRAVLRKRCGCSRPCEEWKPERCRRRRMCALCWKRQGGSCAVR